VTVRKSTQSDDTLTFKGRGSDVIPSNKTNLIYQAFAHVISDLLVERNFFIDIEINNDIPVGKGRKIFSWENATANYIYTYFITPL
jgi:homoserine kinase